MPWRGWERLHTMLDYERSRRPRGVTHAMPTPDQNLSRRSVGAADQPISYFLEQAVQNPGLISMAAGLVDPFSLPASEVRQTFDELLADPTAARAALQYGTTRGYLALRDKLVRHATALDG